MIERASASIYDDDFFNGHRDGSVRSASVIVPLVLRHFPARSVVDIGCGVGAWLAEFARHGVVDYLGIDGDHMPPNLLMIPPANFRTCDLTNFASDGCRFDLACSLEVAEHLPPDCASHFVATLISLAPVVLFSAAIPGQRGTGHVNERWPSYWASFFRAQGYVAVDCIRPPIFRDVRVEPWYRQNAIVFCIPERVPEGFSPPTPYELDRIDLELWVARCAEATPSKKPLSRFFKSRAR